MVSQQYSVYEDYKGRVIESAPDRIPPIPTRFGNIYRCRVTPHHPCTDLGAIPRTLPTVIYIDGKPCLRMIVAIAHIDANNNGKCDEGDEMHYAVTEAKVIGAAILDVTETERLQAVMDVVYRL